MTLASLLSLLLKFPILSLGEQRECVNERISLPSQGSKPAANAICGLSLVCGWLSSLLQGFFRVPWFSWLLKNQHSVSKFQSVKKEWVHIEQPWLCNSLNSYAVFMLFLLVIKVNILSIGHPRSNRSNTRKSVSSDFQTPRSRLEKRGAAEFFLTNFEVFGNRRKHSFECLI